MKTRVRFSLKELGLAKQSPAEIVLTTFSSDKKPHASVAGVVATGRSMVKLRIFAETKTFQNLIQRKAAGINIVRDVNLLVSVALKGIPRFGKFSPKFKKSNH